GFALETSQALGVARHGVGEHLDRNVAIEPGVPRAVHLAHSAFAKLRKHLIGSDARACGEGHVARILDELPLRKVTLGGSEDPPLRLVGYPPETGGRKATSSPSPTGADMFE